MTGTHGTANAGRKRRIYLVEDHPITREGLAQLVNYQPDLVVCGQAGSAPQALDGIADTHPDLVVVDISLGDTSGVELMKGLKARFPKLAMLVLSTYDEALYAERALRAGARGYVMKQSPTADVLHAIRQVLRGEVYLSERMSGRMLHKLIAPPTSAGSEVDLLSDRELEIFELIGRGRATQEIARQLKVSVSTVETHRAHIKEKLDLDSGLALVRRAVEWVERTGR